MLRFTTFKENFDRRVGSNRNSTYVPSPSSCLMFQNSLRLLDLHSIPDGPRRENAPNRPLAFSRDFDYLSDGIADFLPH